MTWNPDQYGQFPNERKLPFLDLLSLVEPQPRMRVLDLGCGTGELTRELHERLDAEQSLGIDSSQAMLDRSEPLPNRQFRLARIEEFTHDTPFDLVFSNAALHWVADHRGLLTRVTKMLSPRGQIAVQLPANDDHPSHSVAAAVAADFGMQPRPDHLLAPEEYAGLLAALGYVRQQVRLQVYGHVLPEPRGVIEWVKGALLIHYEKQLGERYGEFIADYERRLLESLPDEKPYFYTYKRILFWGSRVA